MSRKAVFVAMHDGAILPGVEPDSSRGTSGLHPAALVTRLRHKRADVTTRRGGLLYKITCRGQPVRSVCVSLPRLCTVGRNAVET